MGILVKEKQNKIECFSNYCSSPVFITVYFHLIYDSSSMENNFSECANFT